VKISGYAIAGVVVLAALGYGELERARANGERLARTNAEAAADTTRRWFAGQLQVATRLIVQDQVHLGAALRAAGRPTTAATITVAPAPIAVTTTGTATADTLHGQLDTVGVHVRVTVVAPAWAWAVRRDPVDLQLGLSCDAGAARATVAGPTWAQLTLTDLHQDPGVCNPPAHWAPFSFRAPSLPWLGAAFVAGWILRR